MESRADRGGNDPAVAVVRPLAEHLASTFAWGTQLCVDGDDLAAAVSNLNPLYRRFQPGHPRVAPAAADRAIPELSARLESDEHGRPLVIDAWRSASLEPGAEFRAAHIVSMMIGPRDRTEITT